MTFFAAKSIVATLFVIIGLTAALSMLTLMGRTERRLGVAALRNTHRAAGYVFAALLLVLAVMGIGYLRAARDALPLRGVLHWVLASLLIFLFALKVAVVRSYKQFVKFVPIMGMMVLVLALVVAAMSAGFFAITGGGVRTARPDGAVAQEAADEALAGDVPVGDPARGERLFVTYCGGCHDAASTEARLGPGLAGLFQRDALQSSGKPVSAENVRDQIVAPVGRMPAFESHLTEEQLDHLIAYLRSI